MITYRLAEERDLEELVSLTSEAFLKDPLFKMIESRCRSTGEYEQFVRLTQHVFIKSYLTKTPCFVAIQEQQIVALTILERPGAAKLNLFSYIRNGGLKLVGLVGLSSLLSYIKMLDRIVKILKPIERPNWYVALLAVSPRAQGKGIGGKLLNECVRPFVKQQNGDFMTLCTQTDLNARFYKKNGWHNFAQEDLQWNQRVVSNYGFQMEVQ